LCLRHRHLFLFTSDKEARSTFFPCPRLILLYQSTRCHRNLYWTNCRQSIHTLQQHPRSPRRDIHHHQSRGRVFWLWCYTPRRLESNYYRHHLLNLFYTSDKEARSTFFPYPRSSLQYQSPHSHRILHWTNCRQSIQRLQQHPSCPRRDIRRHQSRGRVH